jgi:hypothetical protein
MLNTYSVIILIIPPESGLKTKPNAIELSWKTQLTNDQLELWS